MEKLFCSGTENQTELKTESFSPVLEYERIVNIMNELYSGCVPLLRCNKHSDGKVELTGSTTLLSMVDYNVDDPDAFSEAWAELKKVLAQQNVPEWMVKIIESNDETSIPLAEFVSHIVAPGQSVRVELTDVEYGNSMFTIEK